MSVPFVGPSYNLRSRTADLQRTIGMIPMPLEPGNERAGWVFKDIPGLVVGWDFGAGNPVRGGFSLNGRTFVVAGPTLWELFSDGNKLSRGTLGSDVGMVGMCANSTQLVFSDGFSLYVMTLSTNSLHSQIYPGKARIDYINQYIVFVTRSSQQFGWTNIGNALTIDPLDFASAESSPDNLVGLLVDHREILLFGGNSTENWSGTTTADIFARNPGVAIEEGLAAEFASAKLDSTVYFLASSSRGQGRVYKLTGYIPVVVSTAAIEERLSGIDLSGATAFAIEMERSKLFCLYVPGLDSTLVFDALTNEWHEWCDLVDGERQPHRARMHLFAFNNHYVGADDGKLYRLDPTVSTNNGDPLLRERITTVSATPGRDRVHYQYFDLTCDRGTGARVAFRYSTDGGARWSNWRTKSVGALGVYDKPVRWKRLNAGRDIVLQVRMTDNAPFNPVQGDVK